MAISTRQVKNKRDSNGVLTGRPGTVYDVNIKYTAPDGKKKSYRRVAWLSMNFEAVTARYVDVRLERKKEVLDAYHGAVKQADPAKAEKAEPKKAKSAAKKKSSDLEL